MMKKNYKKFLFLFLILAEQLYALPEHFVYLKDIDPSIIQEMRYVGFHNFVGRPIDGYKAGECILTRPAAEALHQVQSQLKKKKLSLKVYDCYRPTRAVQEFLHWSKNPHDTKMKAEFYPRVDKKDMFRLEYIAEKSGHSRGSTMDLTIVKLPPASQPRYRPGDKLVSCTAPYQKRFKDNNIDMGTGYDCMDPRSHPLYRGINQNAYKNRMLLRTLMLKQGFVPYFSEWWHFTLKNEPYPHTYFNFPIKAAPKK